MRDWTWLVLLAGTASVSVWACGSDVESTDAATTTASSSSAGGGGGTTTSSSSSSVTSSSSGMQTPCEEACDHIDDCAMMPGLCNVVGDLGFVDISTCSDMQAECAATCIGNTSCASLITLVQGPLDPALETCLTGCFPPCTGCVITSCPADLQACTNDSVCPDYLECINGCGDTDTACIQNCATLHPSAATDGVAACAANNCPAECGDGAGGAGGGGTGGAGGAGGAGGN